jgi:dihydrolipoamide dehydrogenase
MISKAVVTRKQFWRLICHLAATEEKLIHTVFPHPTISETIKEAVLDAYGRVLNM